MLVWLLSAGNFVIGMGAFVVVGMLNPLAEGLRVSTAEAGFVLTAYALAYAVAAPVAVAATGGWPRRQVLLTGMALFGLAAIASARSDTVGALYAARIVAAVGAGLFTPVAAAVAAAAVRPEARGRALARVFFGLTLAQVLGVPAGSYLAYTVGWQAAFGLVAALALACVAGLARTVPADLPFQATRLSALGTTLRDWRTLAAASFTATFLGATYVLYTYLAPLLAATMGLGRDGVTLVLLAYGAGAVAGNLASGRMADRFGPRRTLAAITLSQIALMPLFAFLPLPMSVLLTLVFVWAAFGWSFMAPQQALLLTLAPDRAGVVLALNASAIYLGAPLGSAVGGGVVARAGLSAAGPAAGLAACAALAHLWLAGRAARPLSPSTS